MGGVGSGQRLTVSTRDTTEDYRTVDVRWLHREGALRPGKSGRVRWLRNGVETSSISYETLPDALVLIYRSRPRGGEWESLRYSVPLVRTACHYGGERTWFLCPAAHCGRRVAVLYGSRIYACRYCRQLAYPSQNQKPEDRATERCWRLLKRLDCEWLTIFEPEPFRPKGMHQKTFARLRRAYAHSRTLSLGAWGPGHFAWDSTRG